jgi:hypothetical protein
MAVDPFIDDIYEAAVVPEKWQAILDQLAEMADAEGTLLFAAGPGMPRWLSSKSIQAIMEEWTGSKWYLDNPRGQRLVVEDAQAAGLVEFGVFEQFVPGFAAVIAEHHLAARLVQRRKDGFHRVG